MSRRLLLTTVGTFGAGIVLGAVFMQYRQPGMSLSWLAGMLGCG